MPSRMTDEEYEAYNDYVNFLDDFRKGELDKREEKLADTLERTSGGAWLYELSKPMMDMHRAMTELRAIRDTQRMMRETPTVL